MKKIIKANIDRNLVFNSIPVGSNFGFDELWVAAGKRVKEKEYWLNRFSGEFRQGGFPFTYEHAKNESIETDSISSDVVRFDFDDSLCAGMFRLSTGSDVRLYILLMTVLTLLIGKYSGSDDIIVGTPVFQEDRDDDQRREFINSVLPIRNGLRGDLTFKELVLEVRESVLEAIDNCNYPIEVLIRQLDLSMPGFLFDTCMVLENIQDGEMLSRVEPKMVFSFLKSERSIEGAIEFDNRFYDRQMVEQIAGHFRGVVEQVLANPEIKLSDIDILTEGEKKQILDDFNDTTVSYPEDETIHELFEEQVRRRGDSVAIIDAISGVGADPRVCPQLSYNELNRQAENLANQLRNNGVGPDVIVGIRIERSLEMVVGILGILKAGGAYMPIDPGYPQERINYMLKDSGARLLISVGADPRVCPHSSGVYSGVDLRVYTYSSGIYSGAHAGAPLHSHLAYIIYTSGSTGKPKGVMVDHRNVVRLVKSQNIVPLSEHTRILQTGAPVFDATTYEIWGSLLNGGQLCLVNQAVILDAGRLGETLVRERINTLWLSSPLFNRLVEESSGIFSSLHYLIVGGDVLSPRNINAVRRMAPALRIINGYGPTENTTFSTFHLIEREYDTLIPIGKPIANSTAYIIDKYGNLQPIGVYGELVVGGDGVSRGYLNNPELTRHRFLNSFKTSPTKSFCGAFFKKRPAGGMLYKTGDLCRWLPDGTIQFLGRMDQQVKVRGYRVELGEIEDRILGHEAVKEAFITVNEDHGGDKYICAYLVLARECGTNEIKEYAEKGLPGYMVPSYFVVLDQLPLTPGGKVDRKALPEPLTVSGKKYEAPRDGLESQLVDIWSGVLGQATVGIHDHFFELGGHSLKAMQMVSRVHQKLGIDVPLAEVFTDPTVKGLANYIRYIRLTDRTKIAHGYSSIESVEKKEYYPLSSAQERMYILSRMDEHGIGYNIPFFAVLEGELNKDKFETVFKKLIKRHESLRTSFHMIDDEPVQRVHDEVKFEIDQGALFEKTAPWTPAKTFGFIRRFDLSKAPLMRVSLIKEEDRKHRFMVDMHHIISDGTSMNVVITDFMALYGDEELLEWRVQYKDFSVWQKSTTYRESIKRQETYWLAQFEGEIPVLNLPVDDGRPAVQSFEGAVLDFEIGTDHTRRLKAMASEEGVTLYMLLLGLYNIFLSKLSAQEDIVVGSPSAGRSHADLEFIIGMFVNTLALRNYPVGEKPFTAFLHEVKENTLNAFENQGYQYEELVERVEIKRDVSRNPLFDTMFALQNMESVEIRIPGLTLTPSRYESNISKFDLSLTGIEADDQLLFTFEYSTQLFKPATIERFTVYFKNLIKNILDRKGNKISDIEMITEAEKNRLLFDFNATEAPYPEDKTMDELFEEQVSRTPDHIALVGLGLGTVETLRATSLQLSYRELNQRADSSAQELREKGVQPDTIVGIKIKRSTEMVIGMLGILKSGGAYLPIDPEFPPERIDYILKDSGAKLLINSDKEGLIYVGADPRVCPCAIERIKLGADLRVIEGVNSGAHMGAPLHSNLAYIIYTSGTTGKPKGVMINHRSAANVLTWIKQTYNFGPYLHILNTTEFVLDASVIQIFGTLISGASLHVLPKNLIMDKTFLRQYIDTHRICFVDFVPLILSEFLAGENDPKLKSLKYVISGADKLDDKVKENVLAKGYRLFNHYGPTENAVDTLQCECVPGEPVHLGKPIRNVRIYVLDKNGSLLPIGVPGELYTGGVGVARGYLNRPELTSEKFLNPSNLPLTKSFCGAFFKKRPAGGMLYKTGDLVRWLNEGNIEFLGRLDFQVKIRGYRLELGEIENRLLQYSGINHAIVSTAENEKKEKYLCAYITSDTELDVSDVRKFLLDRLPGYMTPSQFIRVEKIPMTPQGKVDRKTLEHMGTRLQTHTQLIAPGSERETIIAGVWKDVLKLDAISVHENFFDLGGTSMDMIRVNNRLKDLLQIDIPIVAMYKYTTIASFAAYLDGEKPDRTDSALKKQTEPVKERTIAIIGMAGRFPGAKDIETFWENLKNGVESVTFYTDEELRDAGVEPALLSNPNYVKSSGGILDDKEYFDAAFFGYSPNEGEIMDPQVRIFHECTWHALENAGYDPLSYDGRIGLYGGASSSLMWQALAMISGRAQMVGEFVGNMLADRDLLCTWISYALNLKGPAVAVKSACSTSLVAVHLACKSLLETECDMALAGGITVLRLTPSGYLYQPEMIYSPDGHCRAFDASAKGTTGGDGAGLVVLKRLPDALRDNDHIYALIKGTAINNDGKRKAGFTAPSINGQSEVIRDALSAAGIDPETIGYVETHGTGTPVGDPVEIEGLITAFNTHKKQYCALGSVKTNIGHLDAAAGIAGLIKTTLALKHQLIPPSLHFISPNPNIDFKNSPFYVNHQPSEWKPIDDFPRRAGVSSFGIGGTNAHVVLEEWGYASGGQGMLFEKSTPWAPAKTLVGENVNVNYSLSSVTPVPSVRNSFHLVLLSAKTPKALDEVTENLVGFLKQNPNSDIINIINIIDIAYTLQVGRHAFPFRRTAVCSDIANAIDMLATPNTGKVRTGYAKEGQRSPIFMFPGVGSQYVYMTKDLYDAFPLFRQTMDDCFGILKSLTNIDMKEILYPTRERSLVSSASAEMNHPEIFPLALFIVEYSLAQLMIGWGIKPHAMIGYSLGEYTAACVSGVFSLEDALKILIVRGRLIAGLPAGTMLSIPLTANELMPLLDNRLSLAIDNGPSCIVAGPDAALDAFQQKLKERHCLCMRVPNSYAGHSRMMEPILKEFESHLRRVNFHPPQIPYMSNVTGNRITVEDALDPTYWCRHLKQTVRFADGIDRLKKEPDAIFIEIGPGRDLTTLLTRYNETKENESKENKNSSRAVNLIRPQQQPIPDDFYLLNQMGRLWLHGVSFDWNGFYGDVKPHRMPLPGYPFQRQRLWFDHSLFKLVRDMFSGKNISPLSPTINDSSPFLRDPRDLREKLEQGIMTQRSEWGTPYIPPSTETERILASIWESFFAVQPLGIDDDFIELGGDSIKAISLRSRIHQALNVEVPLPEFFAQETIKKLAAFIDHEKKTGFSEIEPAENKEYYALSSAQKRLYILQRMESDSTGYNETQLLWVEGKILIENIETVFRKIIERHDILRTSIQLLGEEVIQQVFPVSHIDFRVVSHDLNDLDHIVHAFVRPFDLAKPPLIRAALINVSVDSHILAIDMHHIITDGWSNTLLSQEFMALYNNLNNKGHALPPLRLQYKDFAEWQNRQDQVEAMKRQETFWIREFDGEIPVLDLPIDYPRPAIKSFEGAARSFEIEKEETAALKSLAQANGVTLYMMLLAIYTLLLSKVSNQEDIVVGTPIAGRRHADLEKIIGMFVNTLAMRSYPIGEKRFTDFLAEVKGKTMAAFENQDYPYEELVDKVNVVRDLSRNPLFDAMLALQNIQNQKAEISGLTLRPYEYKERPSKFDVTLLAVESDDRLHFTFEYSTKLFKPETMERFTVYFKNLIQEIITGDIHRFTLADVEIITKEERNRILDAFNDTAADYPKDKTIHELFEDQVKRTPDSIALIGSSVGAHRDAPSYLYYLYSHISYRQFNEQADRVAEELREKGIEPGMIVGIAIARSIEMMVGIYGILKAGGTYLPIDPGYPQVRIDYLMKDSGAKWMVAIKEGLLSVGADPCVCPNFKGAHMGAPLHASAAYVIYTSGTTGKPKGAMIEHHSLINRLQWMQKAYPLTHDDVILQKTAFTFDVSVWEIFWWGLVGAKLCLLIPGGEKDPAAIIQAISKHRVTVMHFVPSMLGVFLEYLKNQECDRWDHGIRNLKQVFASGEALTVPHVDAFGKLLHQPYGTQLANLYGPTEATIDVSYFDCFKTGHEASGSIPIGKPIDNIALLIFNHDMKLQPEGIAGDLYIAGVGVARGYINRPELTHDKFIIFSKKFPQKQLPQTNQLQTKSFCGGAGGGFLEKSPLLLYKTGDRCKWLHDGNIDYLGRVDHQVKLRGFRIELEEIEARLMEHSAVKEAVVGCIDETLLACVVSEREIDGAELKNHLSVRLPGYMVPSVYKRIERIPLSANGKIDRNALTLSGERADSKKPHVMPETQTEERLTRIWKELLHLNHLADGQIGVHDNFFDLGGTSMDVIRASVRISAEFKKEIPIVMLYQYTTIRALAGFIDHKDEAVSRDLYSEEQRVERVERGRTEKNKMRDVRRRGRQEHTEEEEE
ncbi:MAG: amino acid adenylation domain-containing protein [Candidatus Omnitrophota bacterium]